MMSMAWIVSLSLTAPAELGVARGFLPSSPTLDNYRAVFATPLFVAALRNSVAIACLATSLAVAVATLAAWAVSRLGVTVEVMDIIRAFYEPIRGYRPDQATPVRLADEDGAAAERA